MLPRPLLPLHTRLHQHRKTTTSGEEAAGPRQITTLIGGFGGDNCLLFVIIDVYLQDRNTDVTTPEQRNFTEGIFLIRKRKPAFLWTLFHCFDVLV